MKIENGFLLEVTDDDIKTGTISIPDNIEFICPRAFYNCSKLMHIDIPNSVKYIGNHAFFGCENLEEINLPNNIIKINDNTFEGCISLKSINIPESVTSIGKHAFKDCTNLKNIIFSNNINIIEDAAFLECENLEEISLPNGISSIYSSTFSHCHSLKSITIPNGVKSIKSAFCGCYSLKSVIIPDSVTTIENGAFGYCRNLKSVKLSKNLSYIDLGTFNVCENLKKLIIPPSVKLIKTSEFDYVKLAIVVPSTLINFNLNYNSISEVDVGIKIIKSIKGLERVRAHEIMKAIRKALKNREINNKDYFKCENHKYFIKTILYELNDTSKCIDFKKELDAYIDSFIQNKNLSIETNNIVENNKLEDKKIEQIEETKEEHIVQTEKSLNIDIKLEEAKTLNERYTINEILKKLSELPEEDVFIIRDIVKNNLFDEKIMDYINMSKEEKLKILDSESQPIYKVKLEKEPIEEYIAKQKVKKL